MRDYFEAIHRCLQRRDRHEACRLLCHPFRHALPSRLSGCLADLALGRSVPRPVRPLKLVRELQELMVDESPADPAGDDTQLELALRPAAWSRPVNLTIARAARRAPARGDDRAVIARGDRPGLWSRRSRRLALAGE